ncbi:FAD-dependent oxidoreductase [Agriterribacter sp.]|uniref:NAD(P)/FAD-dependent oxidoreductase n=1 Tax=Agriterribacter sp. TaxID=2821509 RepID=UPI002BCDE55C|nr:FAD-dependent oxidoreductase [Agriterribacter sp.]HRO48116.1 FAD-dependent oxidoreductase [Agriterribacter sp.]HRQ17960.1 FAD-dependent oxidoreductase [Agriterribacter sp.]
MKHIVVIGGGIIGLSSAYYLQQSGHTVTVIDKNDFSDNCSYGNAGYVCPSHFVPLAAPGIVWRGLKWMFNAQSPFYIQPALNRSLADWGLRFARSANARHVKNSAIPLRDIALLSQGEYESWAAIPGFNFAYEHKGLLEIFQTRAVAAHASHTIEQAKSLGLEASLLDADALQRLEPHTRINALGAVLFKCDAHLYPNKLMQGLLSLLRQNGVKLVSGTPVTGFEKNGTIIKKVITPAADFDAGAVVIATGAWSRGIAAMVNTKIPLMPGRGYSVTLEDAPYRLHHPAVLAEGRVAITPMDGNKIRFGGTMEVVSTTTPPRYQRVQGILNAVKSFFPEFDVPMPAQDQLWYGYRPCSADGLPYIGKIKSYSNVVIATGHAMLGLSLGAGTGKLVSEIINEEKSSINLAPFAVERFG